MLNNFIGPLLSDVYCILGIIFSCELYMWEMKTVDILLNDKYGENYLRFVLQCCIAIINVWPLWCKKLLGILNLEYQQSESF